MMTALLIGLHIAAFLLVFYISLSWSTATDACTEQACHPGNITWAIVLTDIVGGVVLLSTSLTAVVLMAIKRIAFWAPLLGMVVQIVLVLLSLITLEGVS